MDEPLATVINLSSILNSVTCNSVAEPCTTKLPFIWTSPVKSPSANVTLFVVARFWLIVSRFALLEWVCVSASKESIRESNEVETAVPANKLLIWDEPLTTPSPSICK